MEERMEHTSILDLMLRPAFSVKDGVICHVNQAAKVFLLTPGEQIMPIILYGQDEYEAFSGGNLSLTLSIAGRNLSAIVVRMEDYDLFLPQQADETAQLQTLALAAMELREPLAGLIAATEQIFSVAADTDSKLQAQAAQANRRLYQMLRMIGNMSDTARYTDPGSGRMEYVEICGFLEEILRKNAEFLSQAGLTLQMDLPKEAIYTLADPEKLERALHNLLSNAAKHAPKESTISVRLTRQNQRLYLRVTDGGPGTDYQNLYTRFLRQPTLEDSRNGIGLGMVLIRSVAAMHGGTVLMDQPEGGGNRVTMSLAIRQSKSTMVRSPILRIDYAGERDHSLLELSDVLPAALYSPDNLK